MALAQLIIQAPGNLIKSADWNNEFQNILTHPIALISPTTGPINFNLQAHTGLLPSVLSATSGATGQSLIASSSGFLSFGTPGVGSRVKGLQGVVSSQTGTFTANQYLLQSTDSFRSFLLQSTSPISISIGTAGPTSGGRDVAAAFSSTEVHWYAISTGQASATVVGIVSSQAPPAGPVLPSSYVAWCYLGASPYTSASTSVSPDQRFSGCFVSYDEQQTVLSNGASTSIVAVSLSTAVPSNALTYQLTGWNCGLQADGGGNAVSNLEVYAVTSSKIYTIQRTQASVGASQTIKSGGFSVPMPLTTNRQVWYRHNIANGTAPVASFDVTGYTVPNGDSA